MYENPYIVEEGVNGFLFNPENEDEIVNAVRKMVALSSAERQEMGKRNRELCMTRNTEEAFLNSYVDLIDRL